MILRKKCRFSSQNVNFINNTTEFANTLSKIVSENSYVFAYKLPHVPSNLYSLTIFLKTRRISLLKERSFVINTNAATLFVRGESKHNKQYPDYFKLS